MQSETKYTKQDLETMRAWSLQRKIQVTQTRIIEWIGRYDWNVYIRNQAAGSAELLLYGDISDSSWWGDEVTPKTFADELNALGPLTSLTVRINSGGGDVFAAQTIGNLLEQHTAQVTARIDGLCASAATIIACHCDKVVAANDSTYMIHPVRMGIFDFADAVTLQQYIDKATKKHFVVELLEANGITVTPEINAFIEAAVKELDLAEKNAIGEIGKIFSDAEQTPQN